MPRPAKTDTAEHVVAWTEYAVQFPDGYVSNPLPWGRAWETRDAHYRINPACGVRVVARTVTPWRVP